jgi:hypothetical protein
VARSESETDLATPTLVAEAIAAGFSIDQIQQAGNELDSYSSSASKVYAELEQGSVVKRIVDVWVDSRKGKVKPWKCPLPLPRRSPVRTFGDVLAKAKVEERHSLRSWQTRRLPTMSSAGPRQMSMPAVTMAHTSPRSEQAIFRDYETSSTEISNTLDGLMELGCHVSHMGHKSQSGSPSVGYRPTPGLITLFSKTGGRRRNPNPALPHQRSRRSHADVVHGSMDQGGSAGEQQPHWVWAARLPTRIIARCWAG